MRKGLFALAAMIAFCVPSGAQNMTNAQSVKLVVPYKTSCSSVTINIAATEMTGNVASSTATAGISSIKVSNLSGSATVCCSSLSTVVCTAGHSFYIEPIFPSASQPNFATWAISTAQPWYCAASSSNTSVSSCLLR